MSIRIQLWKGDTQVGADMVVGDLLPGETHAPAADALVDLILTSIHQGKKGPGKFRIECDHLGDGCKFMGSYYRCETTFPKQRQSQTHETA
jgi:hypothetical protein